MKGMVLVAADTVKKDGMEAYDSIVVFDKFCSADANSVVFHNADEAVGE